MSDITMCKGDNCPLKETCYRYKAKVNEMWQSYFTEIPFNFSDNSCKMYWKLKNNSDETIQIDRKS